MPRPFVSVFSCPWKNSSLRWGYSGSAGRGEGKPAGQRRGVRCCEHLGQKKGFSVTGAAPFSRTGASFQFTEGNGEQRPRTLKPVCIPHHSHPGTLGPHTDVQWPLERKCWCIFKKLQEKQEQKHLQLAEPEAQRSQGSSAFWDLQQHEHSPCASGRMLALGRSDVLCFSAWEAGMVQKARDLNFSSQVKPSKHVAGVDAGRTPRITGQMLASTWLGAHIILFIPWRIAETSN